MQAVLFDLDGTLLASDIEGQLKQYLARLTGHAQAHFPELADSLAADVMQTVRSLIDDADPQKLVADRYWERYCARTGADRRRAEPLFDLFYENEYAEVGNAYTPVPQIAQAVALCRRRGLKLCVATNCFYPLAAIHWRVRWAGLDPADFDCITHYYNMRSTKPSLGYYREAAALLGVPESQCAMVGNDGLDDMPAAELGMQTFLLTPFALHDGEYTGDRGGYDELLGWLGSL